MANQPSLPFRPGTAAQLALVAELAAGEHLHTRLFLLDVLMGRTPRANTGGSQPNGTEMNSGFVPIPSQYRKKHYRHASWRSLRDRGVLEVWPYSRADRKCFAFRPTPLVQRLFAEAGPTAASVQAVGLVDLRTGRPTTRRVKSVRYSPSGNPLPKLVRQTIDAVGPSTFNPYAIEAHLSALRQIADEALAGPARVTAEARFVVDSSCYQAVLAQGARPGDDGSALWQYRPAYRQQRFGRLSQIGGGLQSCSRAMKRAAYTCVERFRNYDLEASQARILSVLLAEAGVDGGWLDRYLVDGKAAAAAAIGISPDVWKTALYAILMGARVPSAGQAPRSAGTVVTALRTAVGADALAGAYDRLLDYTAGLRVALAAWHRWLDGEFVRENGRTNNVDGRLYITNAAGAKIAVQSLSEKPYRRRAQLAAFVLQGREAAFTHALAVAVSARGVIVFSHEHDGLAVQGEIPAVAVQEAADVAGLPLNMVVLVEKPFV